MNATTKKLLAEGLARTPKVSAFSFDAASPSFCCLYLQAEEFESKKIQMNPRIATLIVLCCCLQSSLSVAAETNSGPAGDVKLVQGLWERELSAADKDAGLRRVTKEIKGNKETVTYYGEDDKILRRHIVDFKLGKNGDIHVFTYSNMEVTEGEGQGTKSTESFSYVYRADQESFLEVSGLLPGQEDQPVTVVSWKRGKK